MKKTFRRMLLVCLFVFLIVTFSALSCSITPGPSTYTLSVYNNQGAGITIWVRIGPSSTIYTDYGPYANGWTGSFITDPSSVISIWNGFQWLLFNTSWTNSYTVLSNTSMHIIPGAPAYVQVMTWVGPER